MQCDLDCMTCDYRDTCTKTAAIEWREAEQLENPASERICADCGCHPTIARRIAELERDMASIKSVIFGLAAFFERLGEGDVR